VGSLGLLFAEASIALAVLVPLQIALFAWRAKLEEARLAEFSADYRAYQQRTGFFFPRFRRMGG
jgi:protein-S-isoprenylcysteine O-methyltransferase Ste14